MWACGLAVLSHTLTSPTVALGPRYKLYRPRPKPLDAGGQPPGVSGLRARVQTRVGFREVETYGALSPQLNGGSDVHPLRHLKASTESLNVSWAAFRVSGLRSLGPPRPGHSRGLPKKVVRFLGVLKISSIFFWGGGMISSILGCIEMSV